MKDPINLPVPEKEVTCKKCGFSGEIEQDGTCWSSKCKGKFVNPPTPNSVEGWEVRLGQIASKAWKDGLWHSEAMFFETFKAFIKQELEAKDKFHAGVREEMVGKIESMRSFPAEMFQLNNMKKKSRKPKKKRNSRVINLNW